MFFQGQWWHWGSCIQVSTLCHAAADTAETDADAYGIESVSGVAETVVQLTLCCWSETETAGLIQSSSL